MGKIWQPRLPAEVPPEVVGAKGDQGVAVEKMRRRRPRPRRPAKATLKAVGVKDADRVALIAIDGEVEATAARGGEKGSLDAVCLMDSIDGAPVIATTRYGEVGVKDAEGIGMGKMWRLRRPAKVPPKAVGVEDAKGIAVTGVDWEVKASGLVAPVVRGGEKGPLENGIAMCQMDSLSGAPVITTTRHEPVGVKDARGVAVGKMWRPLQTTRAKLKAVAVKDAEAVAVIAVDRKVDVARIEAPVASVVKVVGRVEKGPLEDGTAKDALGRTPVIITRTRREAIGAKDARGVVVRKMWRPRRPAKPPLEEVGLKDTKGIDVIVVDGEVEASVLEAPAVTVARGRAKGTLEVGTTMCLIDSLDGALVMSMTQQEAVGVRDTEGVVVGKIWRPRRPEMAPLEVVGVKDTEGVAVGKTRQPRRPAKAPPEALGLKDTEGIAVITVDGKVETSVPGTPVVVAGGGGEKGLLEEGIAVCQMNALDGAPVIATTQHEAVGVKDTKGVVVGKMWQPRRPVKAPLEVVGVKDAEGAAVRKMRRPRRLAKEPPEELGVKDMERFEVITVDGKVEASVPADPLVMVDGGVEKCPLEEGIAVCQMDTLDGASVISTIRQEAVGVKDTKGVAVGKMRRPRRPAKAPPEEMGVKDAKGIAVTTLFEEVELLVLGVPVVAAAGCEEKGSLEDGIVVCQMDALDGAPVIATDEKEVVSVQWDPVFPTVDQKVDATVVEGMQAISMKGDGKEDKDKEGIKWLRHYSTAQSILIIGDGDFSFSLALATTFGSGGNLVATSLDSYGALTLKYGKAESNVRELERLGATVLHGVDAQTMKLHSYLGMRRFDRIVFNFPHAGFKGRENQLHVINAHKHLVRGFLANARQLLQLHGEIHLSHKKGLPYDAWGIKKLASESCLIMVRRVDFSKEDYPGYNQKRGDGPTCDESCPLGPCCTFMFRAGDVEKLKQAHGNCRVGSISSCLGDSRFYPGISASTDIMWPFHLHHPVWPQQPHFPPVHLPIAFDPCPFGVAGMEDPLFNCYGTSFHPQDMVQPAWYQEGSPIHMQPTLSLEDHYMESVQHLYIFEQGRQA